MRQSPAGKNMSKEEEDIFGIRHQATIGEDRAGWENLVCPIVICELQ
jgi:hypothetical protein